MLRILCIYILTIPIYAYKTSMFHVVISREQVENNAMYIDIYI